MKASRHIAESSFEKSGRVGPTEGNKINIYKENF
jgi:hypothetical protein